MIQISQEAGSGSFIGRISQPDGGLMVLSARISVFSSNQEISYLTFIAILETMTCIST